MKRPSAGKANGRAGEGASGTGSLVVGAMDSVCGEREGKVEKEKL